MRHRLAESAVERVRSTVDAGGMHMADDDVAVIGAGMIATEMIEKYEE